MVRVGVHVSIAGGIWRSVDRAKERDCNTFQIFSRNPRGWAARELSPQDTNLFIRNLRDTDLSPVVDHMPYLPNLATPDPGLYERSVATLRAELVRCGELEIPYLVTHLGHHQGSDGEEGRKRVIHAVNRALADVDNDTLILLENTAGEKNSVGSSFTDLRSVLDGIQEKKRVAVCLDTCHAFAAGYDFRTSEALSETLAAFDSQIGWDRLRLIHLNDSYGALGSRLDRHEHIGLGHIGAEGFRQILHHPAFHDLPFICETPEDERRIDRDNVTAVRELAGPP